MPFLVFSSSQEISDNLNVKNDKKKKNQNQIKMKQQQQKSYFLLKSILNILQCTESTSVSKMPAEGKSQGASEFTPKLTALIFQNALI